MSSVLPFSTGVFSQWHKCKFVIDNEEYNCAEQYMMACKARLFNDQDMLIKIMSTSSPKEQKEYGRQVKDFDEHVWYQHAEDVVYKGNLAKFGQNSHLKKKLLDTNNFILAEASAYDKIWGIGLSMSNPDIYDIKKWKGKNLLGKALMKVRDHLKHH